MLADTARTHARRLHWLELDDETLERLGLLGGYDDDLAHDVNRAANRLRDMLLAISPALERVLGPRLDHPVARALLQRYPTPTALRAAGRRRPTPRKPAPCRPGRPVLVRRRSDQGLRGRHRVAPESGSHARHEYGSATRSATASPRGIGRI